MGTGRRSSLRRGTSASAGVTIDEISWDGARYRVVPRNEEGVTHTTTFYGTRRGFDASSKPVVEGERNKVEGVSRIYSDEVGEVLYENTEVPAVYRAQGDELYIRAKGVSSELKSGPHREGDFRKAWMQPVVPGMFR